MGGLSLYGSSCETLTLGRGGLFWEGQGCGGGFEKYVSTTLALFSCVWG